MRERWVRTWKQQHRTLHWDRTSTERRVAKRTGVSCRCWTASIFPWHALLQTFLSTISFCHHAIDVTAFWRGKQAITSTSAFDLICSPSCFNCSSTSCCLRCVSFIEFYDISGLCSNWTVEAIVNTWVNTNPHDENTWNQNNNDHEEKRNN